MNIRFFSDSNTKKKYYSRKTGRSYYSLFNIINTKTCRGAEGREGGPLSAELDFKSTKKYNRRSDCPLKDRSYLCKFVTCSQSSVSEAASQPV